MRPAAKISRNFSLAVTTATLRRVWPLEGSGDVRPARRGTVRIASPRRNRTASSRTQYSAGSAHPDTHFFDCLADSRQERPHVRLKNTPDGANAESVGLADFAGI